MKLRRMSQTVSQVSNRGSRLRRTWSMGAKSIVAALAMTAAFTVCASDADIDLQLLSEEGTELAAERLEWASAANPRHKQVIACSTGLCSRWTIELNAPFEGIIVFAIQPTSSAGCWAVFRASIDALPPNQGTLAVKLKDAGTVCR